MRNIFSRFFEEWRGIIPRWAAVSESNASTFFLQSADDPDNGTSSGSGPSSGSGSPSGPNQGTSPDPQRDSDQKETSDKGAKSEITEEIYRRIPDKFKVTEVKPEKERDSRSDRYSPKSEGNGSRSKSTRGKSQGAKLPPPPYKARSNRPGGQGQRHATPGAPPTRSPFSPFLIFFLIAVGVWLYYYNKSEGKVTLISWNGFCAQLENQNIDSVNLRGNVLTGDFVSYPLDASSKIGEFLPNPIFQKGENADQWEIRRVKSTKPKSEGAFPSPDGKEGEYLAVFDRTTGKQTGAMIYRKFRCEIPATALADPELDQKIREKTVSSFTSTAPLDNTGLYMFFSIGLSVLILLFFWRMMRRTNEQIMGGSLNGFTKSPMRRYDPNGKEVSFNDVAGLDNVKKELVEIVDFLKNPEKYQRMGARVPKGTLLFGPPGTGKTLLGRAVAGEAKVPFFSINGSEFMQMFVGVGASRVRELFNTAKENAPCILFIDEIDAVGRQRGTGLGGGHDEREQTLNQILSEMDGFVPTESVMVMAATNRPDVLDPALMRPGRFDRHITVDRPSLKGRKEIFEVYLKRIPKADDVDSEKLARSTVGFTGADIQNLVNEAALWATRNDKEIVDMDDFEFAHAKVIMGLKREETISEENKRKTAYHEAGHTIIDWFSPTNSKVHKVTIVPRGRSLGATYILPEEDQLNVNETEIRAKLAEYLAGRTAESIVYHQTSTGAENDLKEATQLARRMVVHWGMSEKLGPIAFRAEITNPFLGREIAESREYSEATARLIDEEVIRILREAEETARTMLTEKRDLLEKLTDALVEEEELDQERLTEILGPAA